MPRPPATPAPLRLHDNLVLMEVDDPARLDNLEGLPQMRAALIRRLGPTCAALDPARLPALLEALGRRGMPPRVEDEDA